jgi:cytochrome P450
MFGTTNAAVGTTDHDLHRMRRSALNPFFSKQAVMKLEPVIQGNIDRLRDRLADTAGTGIPVNISDAFTCLSADIIGAYAFGEGYGLLDCEDFCPRWRLLMMVRVRLRKLTCIAWLKV